jgi:hypothetical protein
MSKLKTIFSPLNRPEHRYDLQEFPIRLIKNPIAQACVGYINVVDAPTNSGKTHYTIESLFEFASAGLAHMQIFAAVSKSIVDQVVKDAKKYRENSDDIRVLKTLIFESHEVHEFLTSTSKNPKILFITIQQASVEKHGTKNKLLNCKIDRIFYDEADLGGNSDNEMKARETQEKVKGYNATFFTLLDEFRKRGTIVICTTATPLKEQMEEFEMFKFFSGKEEIFKHLNKDVPWPTQEELSEGFKQLRYLKTYDTDNTTYEKIIGDALDLYYDKLKELSAIDNLILTIDPSAPLGYKGVVVFNGGPQYKSGKVSPNSLTVPHTLDAIIKYLNKNCLDSSTKDDYRVLVAYDNKWVAYNSKGKSKTIKTWNECADKLNDVNDPLSFVCYVAKIGRGVNIPNIAMVVSLRERLQPKKDKDFYRTQSIVQFYGRAIRTNYGLDNSQGFNFHFVSEPIKWLEQKYPADHEIKNLYMKHFRLTNSFDILSPKNATFDAANELWTKKYVTGIENSQFNGYFSPVEVAPVASSTAVTQPHDKTCNCDKCDFHNGTTKQGLDKTLGI